MALVRHPMAFHRPVWVQPAPRGPLGDWATDLIGSITTGAQGLIETATGAKAQREARSQAVELARIQSETAKAQAQASAQLWGKSLPWLAAAGVVLVGGIILLGRKK